ncbi:hypothetical protein TNCV_4750611 [Trichonephila clavipes]|nr:hypothetical protein TNCV_4750611 [Trichonephila clavipes]
MAYIERKVFCCVPVAQWIARWTSNPKLVGRRLSCHPFSKLLYYANWRTLSSIDLTYISPPLHDGSSVASGLELTARRSRVPHPYPLGFFGHYKWFES